MTLPGWDSIDTVSRLVKFFTIAGFASLFLLGVFQVLGYLYSIRKNELIQAEQRHFQTQQVLVAEARDRELEQQRQAAIAQALERQKEAEKKLAVLEEKQGPRNLSSDAAALHREHTSRVDGHGSSRRCAFSRPRQQPVSFAET